MPDSLSTKEAGKIFETEKAQAFLDELYTSPSEKVSPRERYMSAINAFVSTYGDASVGIYSAPGRSEIGGNHTDHQHGEVLAASISDDAIAIASRRDDGIVSIRSEGYDRMITADLSRIESDPSESGTSLALVKGILSRLRENGHKTGGFNAYITSNVLSGSGLSSSAAFETLTGTIISGLFNEMQIDAKEIAITGQYAENVYFGKPCGLMDQMACSVGSLCHIDFADPKVPVVERIDASPESFGYCLCITDTRGSHANLTPEYAAIPAEMKAVASIFGKEVLNEVDEKEVLENVRMVREKAGDRALLRAIHFFEENRRVKKEVEALKAGDFESFLEVFRSSARSSFQYLQNVYTASDPKSQNTSVALALSDVLLSGDGAARIHGGGFAGTIQAFVKREKAAFYRDEMNKVFGEDACSILSIRKCGGIDITAAIL